MLTEYSSSYIHIPLIKGGGKRTFFFSSSSSSSYQEDKDVFFDSLRKEKRIFKRIIRDSIQNILSVQDFVSLPPLTRFISSSFSPPSQHNNNNNKYPPLKLFFLPQQEFFHLYPPPPSVPLLSINLFLCSCCSASGSSMALKAVHVTDVPNLDQVKDNAAALNLYSDRLSKGVESVRTNFKSPKFLVIGHRGSGMNMLQSSDKRMKAIKENSILSFNNAANFGVDFVEFDVQVTQDDCPIIFHDNFILTRENNGSMLNTRVTELTLADFLRFGPQRDAGNVGRPLFRRTKDQQLFEWKVENDDSLCTLQEAFQKVNSSLGFNVELKFDDLIVYEDEQLIHVLQVILGVVFAYAGERPVIFSTFQPDAARLMRRLQDTYPVFFLTNGGSEVYKDVRRNSLDEAIKLCLENGLQGIVSEVKALFKNLGAVTRIKEAHLSLLTYGQLNNVSEAVYLQHLMGVEGVIVDFVPEITKAVTELIKPVKEGEEDSAEGQLTVKTKAPKFTQIELMFLQKLISELIQH